MLTSRIRLHSLIALTTGLSQAATPGVAPTATAQTHQGTIVVLNKSAATANIIDVASGRILATLPTGDGPHEVKISTDGRIAVGADYGGRTPGRSLTVIDVPGRTVLRTVDLGDHTRPHGLAFLPGDSLIAVTSESTHAVVIVRVSDGGIVRTFDTEQRGSHMLALTGDGEHIFTGNIGDNTVSELLVSTGQLVRTIDVPPQPEAITVTPEGDEVWVGSNARGVVSVVETATGEVHESLEGFEWPYRILITPDRRLALIPDLGKNQLRFVDPKARGDIATMDFEDAGPQGITLSGDATTAYLSLSRRDRIAIIDLARREVTGYYETGSGPDGIAFTSLVSR
jgi:DNA-binding beta-propeller fold protein YncE